MKYIEPQMEVIGVEVEDIIRTSDGLSSGGDIPANPTPGTGEGSSNVPN